MTDLPLEKREELAEQGLLAVESDDGGFVAPDDAYVCPVYCGKVFQSESSYENYCPTECEMRQNYLRAKMEMARKEPRHNVYIMVGRESNVLKVTDDFQTALEAFWWRSVHHVLVRHYPTAEEALEAQERFLQTLRPLYDVQPNLIGEPEGYSEMPPDPDGGAKTQPIAFKVTEEEELRIAVAAEKAGLSVSEWLRAAVRRSR